MAISEEKNRKALEGAIKFIEQNKEGYNKFMEDHNIVMNYISGNGFSPTAREIFESYANGSVRTRAKVNASFLSGYVNQLKGLLIANKFDLTDEPPAGLVNAVNNAAVIALEEALNFGVGYIYIDGETIKSIGAQNVIIGHSENDVMEDCKEAVILTTQQADSENKFKEKSQLLSAVSQNYKGLFDVSGNTVLKTLHYKLDKEAKTLTVSTFIDDKLTGEPAIYTSDFLPITRAVCKKVLSGNKMLSRGIYIGVRDLLDGLSLNYSVIRSKVSMHPDAFAISDKRAINDKSVADAWDAPYGRPLLPYIGHITGKENEPGTDVPPPTPINIPLDLSSLHQDSEIIKSDIQNILGFNYVNAENLGNETVQAALLRRDNSYNSQIAYIEPVAQAIMHIIKVYNQLLNKSCEVVNKVFIKIEQEEKLRKVLAIIQNPQKGYEGLLAKYAGFSEDETAEIIQASGSAQLLEQTQSIMAENEQLKQTNESLSMDLMNYRLDTSKVVESNQIRANVELAKSETNAKLKLAELALKDKEIVQKYQLEIEKLMQNAQKEVNNVEIQLMDLERKTGGVL
jgi:hypothetical protein